MNRRVSVRAIVLHQGKLLCVRQMPYTKFSTSDPLKPNDYWNLPGGGLDDGEALEDCLRREMLEETGIAAEAGNLMYVQQFIYEGIDFLEFFYHVKNGQDFLNVDLSKTTHGETEIAEIAFIDPTDTATYTILPEFLQTEPLFTSIGLPTKIFSRY